MLSSVTALTTPPGELLLLFLLLLLVRISTSSPVVNRCDGNNDNEPANPLLLGLAVAALEEVSVLGVNRTTVRPYRPTVTESTCKWCNTCCCCCCCCGTEESPSCRRVPAAGSSCSAWSSTSNHSRCCTTKARILASIVVVSRTGIVTVQRRCAMFTLVWAWVCGSRCATGTRSFCHIRVRFVCLSPSCFGISAHDLCRRLLARSTSAENG